MLTTLVTLAARPKKLFQQYLIELDKHIMDLKQGKAGRAFEIRDFAALLYVHPVHLSNTVKEVTGKSTCDWYEEKLLNVSKELLLETDLTIAAIAQQLTYDPSNFTKFFKHYTGVTPKQFRSSHLKS
jgi:AraC family transcriptional regulator, regulatory protein of adaptative response / methylphosphotriester-DNA alkyltransferase methyltransferase